MSSRRNPKPSAVGKPSNKRAGVAGASEKQWVLYMLACGDGTLYTGMTDDLSGRLKRHRAGKGAKYTRGRLPLRLAYTEPCIDRANAMRRERAVKKLTRGEKLALVSGRIIFKRNGTYLEVKRQHYSHPSRRQGSLFKPRFAGELGTSAKGSGEG